ncbi:MAG: DUF1587 domain-containing protein, partial [Pirellula sp.]
MALGAELCQQRLYFRAEGFANVGDAMPVTPELVERYHQAARDVAARA